MTSRGLIALTLSFSTLALAGCAEPKPPLLSGLMVRPEAARELGYRIAWPSDVGLSGDLKLVFAELLGDRLVTFDSGRVVSVINTATGKVLWQDKVGQDLERFFKPRRSDSLLVLCSETRAHIYDIEQGGLVNVFKLAHTAIAAPLIEGGLMIHGSPSGLAFAQDLKQGLVVWRFQTGGPLAASPIAAGPMVITSSSNGNVFAFNPQTGVPVWRNHAWGKISTEARADDVRVYVASEDRSLYAFNRAKGTVEWRHFAEAPLKRPPHLFGTNVYQYVPDEGIVALEAETKKKLWSLPWHDAEPIMFKDGKLFLHRPGMIVTVTPDDGLVLATVKIPAVHFILRDKDNNLYMCRTSGRILKLVPQ